MPHPDQMTPEERSGLQQRFKAMPGRGVDRYRQALQARGQPAPAWHPPMSNPPQAQGARQQPSMGFGQEMANQGARNAEIQSEPHKIKKTTTKKADGTTIETMDMGTGKITETKKDGVSVSQKVVQNDATWRPQAPAAQQSPTFQFEPPGAPSGFTSTPAFSELPPGQQAHIRGSARSKFAPSESQRAFGMALAADPYAGGAGLGALRQNKSGDLVASDFTPFMPRKQQGLDQRKIKDLIDIRKRLGGGEDPGSPEAQARQVFTPPERTLSNMDWTPSKKLLDFIYGSNLAQGSKDPLEGEFKRSLDTFKANAEAAKTRGGKGAKSATKQLKDWDDLRDSLSLDPDEQMKHRIKQAQLANSIIDGVAKSDKLKYNRDMRTTNKQIDRLPLSKEAREVEKWKAKKKYDAEILAMKKKKANSKSNIESKNASAAAAMMLDEGHALAAMAQGKADGSFDPTNLKDIKNYPLSPEEANTTTKLGRATKSLRLAGMAPAARRYWNAATSWTLERTRKVSGAAIKDNELPAEISRFWPEPGDTPQIVRDKAQRRRMQEKMYLQRGASGGWNPNSQEEIDAKMGAYDKKYGYKSKGNSKTSKALKANAAKRAANAAKRKANAAKRAKRAANAARIKALEEGAGK